MREFGIYVHIPFCVSKCAYCDFLSAPADDETKRRYMDALETEIEQVSREYRCRRAVSVFFGGGTPSVVDTELLVRCIGKIKNCFDVSPDAEITMEINPGTVSGKKLAALRKAGVNRLSIGLQSADDSELKMLGRIHSCADFLRTYTQARDAGFGNVNIDLISALPGQSVKSWVSTLEFAADLAPEHISAYSLIVEEGTRLYDNISQYPPLPDEETDRLMYGETKRILADYGYRRYEISNYAKMGFESRHNKIYWQRGCSHVSDYIGLGLGASSTVVSLRYKNTDNLREYMELCHNPASMRRDVELLDKGNLMAEFVILGLRMMEGISASEFFSSYGVKLEAVYGKPLLKWQELGCLEKKGDFYFLTDKGIDVSNMVLSDFLPE